MRRFLVLLLLVCPAAVDAAPPVNPPVVEYTIDVRLDPETKMLAGRETLVWRNPSNDEIRELQFHLYLNAFKNNRSTFMRESGGKLRGDLFDAKTSAWGWIDVRSMKTRGGEELMRNARFIHPDSPDPDDQTVLSVPLSKPVPPRGELTLDIVFEAKLPKVFARTGFARDFFLVAQWFPKIGVYEPAGRRHRPSGGWNTHQFHANSEFYADFGHYDVTITLPDRFVVGASGKQLSKKSRGGLSTYRFREENVHDFAWTADPRFVKKTYVFDPVKDVPSRWRRETAKLLGVPEEQLQLEPVTVTMLMQPDHVGFTDRYRKALNFAIAFCGLRYGPYPYGTITLVDPPEDGSGAGGMEYPGLFTAGTSTALARWPLDKVRAPEIVTVHEFGHEYWYGMVASNEFEESWLDEGITSYTEGKIMDAAYRWGAIEFPGGMKLSTFATQRASYLAYEPVDPIVTPSWKYVSNGSYGTNSYPKPGLILRQMELDLGEALFARCIRAYFQRWSFRHPDTHDFFATFEEVSGRDLSAYRNAVFFGTGRYDLLVQSAKSVAESSPVGVFDQQGKKITKKASTKDGKKKKEKRYRTTVVVARTGEMPMGGEVLLRFTNGKTLKKFIAPTQRWAKYEVLYTHKLASVEIDPRLENLWDTNLLNNSKVLEGRSSAPAKLAARAETFLTQLIQIFWIFV